jgi:hypothetical protein
MLRLPIASTFFSAALAVAGECAAQAQGMAGFEDRPELHQSLSRAAIDSLQRDFEHDFRVLDSFGGGRRGIDRFPRDHVSAQNWKLYGRFYLVNFQNEIGNASDETRFTWRRTGPGIKKSRVYIGFHRQF